MRRRKRLRLKGFDYSAPGAYFTTMRAQGGAELFASFACGALRLTTAGCVVERCWAEIPTHFPSVELDVFVVMPNHVHGIVILGADPSSTLPVVVGTFKSAVARTVNLLRRTPGAAVWQRGYHERIIRSEDELEAIRRYILDNPAAWSADPENPSRTSLVATAPWL